jgi:hypothetical protein
MVECLTEKQLPLMKQDRRKNSVLAAVEIAAVAAVATEAAVVVEIVAAAVEIVAAAVVAVTRIIAPVI